jgi:hypothetical protein
MKNLLLILSLVCLLSLKSTAQTNVNSKTTKTTSQKDNQSQFTYFVDFIGTDNKESYDFTEKNFSKIEGLLKVKVVGIKLKWYVIYTDKVLSRQTIESVLKTQDKTLLFFSQDDKELEKYIYNKKNSSK